MNFIHKFQAMRKIGSNTRYFDYLSRYNNNLISFSKPKTLDIDASQEIFKELFKKLVMSFHLKQP